MNEQTQMNGGDVAALTAATPAPAADKKVKRAAKPKKSGPVVTLVKDGKKVKAKAKAAPKVKKARAVTGNRLVPADLSQYHKDNVKKTAGGNTSIDCNDKVAVLLRGKSLDDIYPLVAKKCDVTEKELRAKYKHLNLGMQRMNLGNKLRAVVADK
jgi:hypothetical protein